MYNVKRKFGIGIRRQQKVNQVRKSSQIGERGVRSINLYKLLTQWVFKKTYSLRPNVPTEFSTTYHNSNILLSTFIIHIMSKMFAFAEFPGIRNLKNSEYFTIFHKINMFIFLFINISKLVLNVTYLLN